MFQVFDSLPSTNDYCLDYAKKHPNERLVCIAHEQTNGRGRNGKIWHSQDADNLYLSYLRPHSSLRADSSSLRAQRSNPGPLSLIVGLVLAQLLESFGLNHVQLKWPNDILISDAKVAGILIEGPVIGIGVNLSRPSSDALHATGLKEQGLIIDKMTLAEALIERLEVAIVEFETTGFGPFIPRWKTFDCLAGHRIAWQNGLTSGVSVALGVNEAGALMIQDEPYMLHSGSVARLLANP